MRNRDKKNIMIVALLMAVVFMSVGYGLLSTQIKNKDNLNFVDPVWDVKITSISSTMTEGVGKSLLATVENRFSVRLNSEIKTPEDKVSYVINVKNNGTIDAKLNSISITPENYPEDVIIYSLEGIEAGDELKAGDSKLFVVHADYNEETTVSSEKNNFSKEITLILDYVQK